MKNKTALEKRWHESIADFASNSDFLIKHFGGYCFNPHSFHIHHVEGRQAKRKINYISERIGEWFVLPVPIELHDVNRTDNKLNVTHNKKAFEKNFGTQKSLWLDMINQMRIMNYEIPFGQDTIEGVVNG